MGGDLDGGGGGGGGGGGDLFVFCFLMFLFSPGHLAANVGGGQIHLQMVARTMPTADNRASLVDVLVRMLQRACGQKEKQK